VKTRKVNCFGHIFQRNYLLNYIIEGKIKGRVEVTGRRGRISRHVLDDLEEKKGY